VLSLQSAHLWCDCQAQLHANLVTYCVVTANPLGTLVLQTMLLLEVGTSMVHILISTTGGHPLTHIAFFGAHVTIPPDAILNTVLHCISIRYLHAISSCYYGFLLV
jgi:hypothetical protein